MRLPYHRVDSFTQRRFAGNPAGVVLCDDLLEPELMQSIATENNLAETAFVAAERGGFNIRWFTPTVEVDLCGHATLAAAFVLYSTGRVATDSVRFSSRSGVLTVLRDAERLALDFPARPPEELEVDAVITAALGVAPVEWHRAAAMMAVLGSEREIRELRPDLQAVARLPGYGLVVTAPGEHCDFVSRFFAPQIGIDEDPVTGATHCTLTPYWARRLGKSKLHAMQLSARGGELWCEARGDRVVIAGHCLPYFAGHIEV